jgi:two-component system, LytTR family, response regulator
MTSTLKAVIIDDEKNAVNALKIIIEEFAPAVEVSGTASSAREGLSLIKDIRPDVVFLDIQMPHMTGMELLDAVEGEKNFEVVFLTAFNNYAQEAFKRNAFYYLLKPINIPDFLMVVNKLVSKSTAEENAERQSNLKKAFENKISIPTSNGIEFITISDIVRIEASGSYVTVYLTGNKSHVFSKNLKSMEELLSHHPFFRAHKSHLINISYIKKFTSLKDGGTITMTDGSEIDLSRAHKEEFVSIYKM